MNSEDFIKGFDRDKTIVSEAGFRRGYTQGAAAVLDAVVDSLPPARYATLHEWIHGDLIRWRASDEAGFPPSFKSTK